MGNDVVEINFVKGMLSNTAPNAATHTMRSEATEISAGTGYTSGGATATATFSRTGGVSSIIGVDLVFTGEASRWTSA